LGKYIISATTTLDVLKGGWGSTKVFFRPFRNMGEGERGGLHWKKGWSSPDIFVKKKMGGGEDKRREVWEREAR